METREPRASNFIDVLRNNNADVVRRSSGNPDSPVTPDLVLEGLRPTVDKLGRDLGRVTFLKIFPGEETAFDSFFREEAPKF